MTSITQKTLVLFFVLGALNAVFSSNKSLEIEHETPSPSIRFFAPMSLDIFHVTTPDIEKLQPYKNQPPQGEKENEIFKGILSFMSSVVFLQTEGVLWDDELLYPDIVLTAKGDVISRAHAPYIIDVRDVDPLTQAQEWYRQKNVALMVGLWHMALGQKGHRDAPCALRRLMHHLDVHGQASFEPEDTFIAHLNRVNLTYKDMKKTSAKDCQYAFQDAAWHLLKWLDIYEQKFYS
jgi:hypothetical protein